jgi:hypothetical protein
VAAENDRSRAEMRDFLKRKLIENPACKDDESLADSAAMALESRTYEKKQTPNIYRNAISGVAMQIVRATKAGAPFKWQTGA